MECFFSILTREVLRRGEFSSRDDLVAKMLGFVAHRSETAKAVQVGLRRQSGGVIHVHGTFARRY
jgi:hypothetical protein